MWTWCEWNKNSRFSRINWMRYFHFRSSPSRRGHNKIANTHEHHAQDNLLPKSSSECERKHKDRVLHTPALHLQTPPGHRKIRPCFREVSYFKPRLKVGQRRPNSQSALKVRSQLCWRIASVSNRRQLACVNKKIRNRTGELYKILCKPCCCVLGRFLRCPGSSRAATRSGISWRCWPGLHDQENKILPRSIKVYQHIVVIAVETQGPRTLKHTKSCQEPHCILA
jgi:hypothetical protein